MLGERRRERHRGGERRADPLVFGHDGDAARALERRGLVADHGDEARGKKEARGVRVARVEKQRPAVARGAHDARIAPSAAALISRISITSMVFFCSFLGV